METDINSKISEPKPIESSYNHKLVRDKIFEQSWKKFQKFKEERELVDKMNWNRKLKEHQVMDNKRYISILKSQVIKKRKS
jgi:hypothetical protein